MSLLVVLPLWKYKFAVDGHFFCCCCLVTDGGILWGGCVFAEVQHPLTNTFSTEHIPHFEKVSIGSTERVGI
jgi:hypothetical protein